MSDLRRNVITLNRLSIHIANGDIFYENHNTGENFYNFLIDQQNEDAAFIPKKFAYTNTFEKYINSLVFCQLFQLTTLKNTTSMQIKMINICFIILTTMLMFMGAREGK